MVYSPGTRISLNRQLVCTNYQPGLDKGPRRAWSIGEAGFFICMASQDALNTEKDDCWVIMDKDAQQPHSPTDSPHQPFRGRAIKVSIYHISPSEMWLRAVRNSKTSWALCAWMPAHQ